MQIEKSRIAKLRERLATDSASVGVHCLDLAECDRTFVSMEAMLDHAEAVHTFSDIEELVRDAVRDKYNREGNYKANPPISSIWAYTRDLATDWVVFEVNKGDKGTLYKSSYSITDGNVTLGEPVEVVRKTVYELVKKTGTES